MQVPASPNQVQNVTGQPLLTPGPIQQFMPFPQPQQHPQHFTTNVPYCPPMIPHQMQYLATTPSPGQPHQPTYHPQPSPAGPHGQTYAASHTPSQIQMIPILQGPQLYYQGAQPHHQPIQFIMPPQQHNQ